MSQIRRILVLVVAALLVAAGVTEARTIAETIPLAVLGLGVIIAPVLSRRPTYTIPMVIAIALAPGCGTWDIKASSTQEPSTNVAVPTPPK